MTFLTLPRYLIIDQGGQSTRAVLFDTQGKVITTAHCGISTYRSSQGYIEHDCKELLDSIHQVVAEVLKDLAESELQSLRAGLVTQRSSMVCWNRATGKSLTPVISWQDTRGKIYLGDFQREGQKIRARTGLVVNAHYGASKIRWCLAHVADVQACRTQGELAVGPLAAYLVFQLTGHFQVDPANGSRTLLMNIHKGCWETALLTLTGIEKSELPALSTTVADYGMLKHQAGALPLRLVNGDQSAAFSAYGELQQGTAYINAGSGAFVACRLPTADAAPASLLLSPVFCDDSGCQLVCEGTVNGAANALEYYRQQFALDDYRDLDLWATRYDDIPLFINGIGGMGSPYWRSDIPSQFVGEGTPQQKLLAVMESIVFMLLVNLEQMKQSGISVQRIFLAGGLSRYRVLAGGLARLSGLPVYLGDDPEATARGAAFQLAGFPTSWQPPVLSIYAPGAASALDLSAPARFARWQQLMPLPDEGSPVGSGPC